MPRKPLSLRPHDVAVALQLAVMPALTYGGLAPRVKLSLGEAHNSVQRLKSARLVHADQRRVVLSNLLQFLEGGVPYAFPADLGRATCGVPTAHSALPLLAQFGDADPLVWPSANGTVRGTGIIPLHSAAPMLRKFNPRLYELLALTDAVRIGQARERNAAIEMLTTRLSRLP